MSTRPLTETELGLVRAFNEEGVRFLVVGMSAAALQGAMLLTEDFDLWIEDLGSEKFRLAVTKAGAFYVPPALTGFNPPMLGPFEKFGIFDLVVNLTGLQDFDSEYSSSIEMTLQGEGMRILPLERIIVSKRATNREKDRLALPSLENTLRLVQKRRD